MAKKKKPAQQHRVNVKGWVSLKNKQREYKWVGPGPAPIPTKNGVISKRQYQKLQAEQTLGAPVSSLEKAASIRADKAAKDRKSQTADGWLFKSGQSHMARHNALVRDFKKAECKRLGLKPTKKNLDSIKVRGDSDSANRFRLIQQMLKSKDNSPTGEKAKALQMLGRRDQEWIYPVGESPK